jgi:hypothetical protein
MVVRDGHLFLASAASPWQGLFMPRVARIVLLGLPHHVTQRGNYRQDVILVFGAFGTATHYECRCRISVTNILGRQTARGWEARPAEAGSRREERRTGVMEVPATPT